MTAEHLPSLHGLRFTKEELEHLFIAAPNQKNLQVETLYEDTDFLIVARRCSELLEQSTDLFWALYAIYVAGDKVRTELLVAARLGEISEHFASFFSRRQSTLHIEVVPPDSVLPGYSEDLTTFIVQ